MANINSVQGNPIVLGMTGLDSDVHAEFDSKMDVDGYYPMDGITGGGPLDTAAWVQRVCPGTDGPARIDSIHGNTVVQDNELQPVRMTGVESVGFNQLDLANILTNIYINGNTGKVASASGTNVAVVEVIPNTDYCLTYVGGNRCIIAGVDSITPVNGDDTRIIFNSTSAVSPKVFNSGSNRYVAAYIATSAAPASDICINLSGPRNGEYEPHWRYQRSIDASTYFPDGMWTLGNKHDTLTDTSAETAIAHVDMGTLTWKTNANWGGYRSFYTESLEDSIVQSVGSAYVDPHIASDAFTVKSRNDLNASPDAGMCLTIKDVVVRYPDASTVEEFAAAMQGVMLHYALATPTTTPIEPPLNLTYKAAAGGTERVMHDEPTAPPTLVVQYGSTADGIRDRALAAIATLEGSVSQHNYSVGDYLTFDGHLCRVTVAIATGESIVIGSNVAVTTVMEEVLSLLS